MSEELKITFGGEVQEKIGTELTQALDHLSRSLESSSRQGAAPLGYAGIPILKPSMPPPSTTQGGLILPDWTAERRGYIGLPETPRLRQGEIASYQPRDPMTGRFIRQSAPSPQAPQRSPAPPQAPEPSIGPEAIDPDKLSLQAQRDYYRLKWRSAAVEMRKSADDYPFARPSFTPAERKRYRELDPERYAEVEAARKKEAEILRQIRPERGTKERVSQEEFSRRVESLLQDPQLKGMEGVASVQEQLERSLRERVVPWGRTTPQGPQLGNWEAQISLRKKQRDFRRQMQAGILRATPKPFRQFASRMTGRMGGMLGQQAAGVGGAMIGGIVGAGTGSPTAGALAGTAGYMALGAAPELAPLILAAGILAESFRTLDRTVGHVAEGLREYDPRVARAEAVGERNLIQYKLQQRKEIGGISAEYVAQEKMILLEWEKTKTEIVKAFGEDIISLKELIVDMLKISQNIIKGLGWLEKFNFNPIEIFTHAIPVIGWLNTLKDIGKILDGKIDEVIKNTKPPVEYEALGEQYIELLMGKLKGAKFDEVSQLPRHRPFQLGVWG